VQRLNGLDLIPYKACLSYKCDPTSCIASTTEGTSKDVVG